jgi:uncharacterized membrane protein YjgN (DUF898 family)
MALITITCPHCSFSRVIDPAVIPPGAVSAVCPNCQQRFSMAHAVLRPHDEKAVPDRDGAAPGAADFGGDQYRSAPPAPPPSPRQTGTADWETLPPRLLPFTFTGRAGEYFGIWIVNILLKIVTCGIYSAWAKVRKRRYFYGNTLLDESPFGYLADPLALFRGWLIGAVLFIIYMIGTRVSPALSFVFVMLLFAVTPWLIVRSRMFNQRNTEHRGIRFSFRANYQEAYLVFGGLPFLMPFTLGLVLPYMVYRQKRFFVENSSYGQTACTFSATAEDFYRLFVKGLGIFILILGVFFVGMFALSFAFLGGQSLLSLSHHHAGPAALQKSVGIAAVILMLLILPLYLTFAVYLETALANLTWNATAIGGNRFSSSLRVLSILWIRLSNALAIFFTLGLMIPWATVRMARYRFGQLALAETGDLHRFAAAPREDVGPAGEEIGDIFGIDIAL